MMQIEYTGLPCSGKSFQMSSKNNVLIKSWLNKCVYVLLGFFELSFSEFLLLVRLVFRENIPKSFRFSVLFNILSKFGVFYCFKNSERILNVDEGISHLPFNLLESNLDQIEGLLKKRLPYVNVVFVCEPSCDELKIRLLNRGHKRLKYYPLDMFIEKNKLAGVNAAYLSKLYANNYSELGLC